MTLQEAAVTRERAPIGPSGGRLRILVCPHELVTGGSQINAIDLAAQIRDRGHQVTVFAPRGPLVDRIVQLGLSYVEAPSRRRAFDPQTHRAMSKAIRRLRPDIVHTYEWQPSVDASLIAFARRIVNVVTVLSMDVPDFIPRDVPLIVGTADLADGQTGRRGPVELIEPPIDIEHDRPRDRASARRQLGLGEDEYVVAVVGRLSYEHEKARGVIAAIQAAAALSTSIPIVLVVAGTGDESALVSAAASAANATAGRLVVRLEGDVADPRSVYAAADVVFGMGGSALRAMAHERTVIVQGRNGFWRLLSDTSVEQFFRGGFFGDGPSGGPSFAELIAELAADPERRESLGIFGRRLVEERYSLRHATDELERIYRSAKAAPGRRVRPALLGAAFRFARFGASQIVQRTTWLARLLRRPQ